jgi:hypothetical protein
MVDTDCPEISTTGTEADASTHTSDRKSARPQRIEVITRGERRRRWSLEAKLPRDTKVVRSTTRRLAGLVGRRADVAQPWGDQTGGAGFYPPLWSRRA